MLFTTMSGGTGLGATSTAQHIQALEAFAQRVTTRNSANTIVFIGADDSSTGGGQVGAAVYLLLPRHVLDDVNAAMTAAGRASLPARSLSTAEQRMLADSPIDLATTLRMGTADNKVATADLLAASALNARNVLRAQTVPPPPATTKPSATPFFKKPVSWLVIAGAIGVGFFFYKRR